MQTQDEDFLKILLETFVLEAREHVEILSNGLLELENSENQEKSGQIIETLFREAHSLKGAARSVNISEIEEICKSIENVFGKFKKSGDKIPKELINYLLESVDFLAILANTAPEKRGEQKPKVQKYIEHITELLESDDVVQETNFAQKTEIPKEELSKEQEPQEKEISRSFENEQKSEPKTELQDSKTIRVPVEKLNKIMTQSEEMLFVKIVSARHIEGVENIFKETNEWKKKIESGVSYVKKQTYSLRELSEQIKKLEVMLLKEIARSKNDERLVNIMVDRLLDEMKEALMLPFSTLFFALPKTVHDMAVSVGKEAMLKVEGGEIEIDRRILEEMKDPLNHLLRNAVDHGIESPEIRAKKQKPNKGLITISLKQESSSKVSIIVRDDGAGMDKDKLIESALKNGIIDKDESQHLDSQAVLSLIFKSGVTTSKIVSDLSGRGLGLAIVKEKIQRLGGGVDVKNLDEGGSEFNIVLPLTLSTFRGVLVSVNERRFIFPSINVRRVMEIMAQEIKTIETKETLIFNHQVIPFVLLRDILGIQASIDENKKITVAVVESGGDLIALGVDEILYEEEVMIKSLGKQLSRVKNISGVALLSSDKPALILNVQDLFKSIGKAKSTGILVRKEEVRKKRRVMVVDDSPTTRILLKNILDIAGYDVVSANDGLEAYTELKKGTFDLLVSDIQMPRMNGFELTESIRGDKVLSELPIVLVTALESPEDKERGMRAGANAYIVKSSFDQNNLMETIKWLIN